MSEDRRSSGTEPAPSAGTAMDEAPVPIVGIGASAGGLQALEDVFRGIGDDSGAAFVVLQHLSPDFKSHMPELLGRVTDLPVQQADDGMRLAPNNIYLIPPRKEMIVSGGRLLLTDKEHGAGLSRPIDRFFRSMARECGPRAVAVVLSGTGSDGARGAAAVSEAGGRVIAQAPDESGFDGMPRSAIATGVVDVVLPAAEIADAVARILSMGSGPGSGIEAAALDRLPEQQVVELLLARTQIDFSCYKESTFSRRLGRRMELSRAGDMMRYVRKLREDAGELDKLFHDLLIDVTSFFRDPHAYDQLRLRIDAEWFTDEQQAIRIWVAGCATGQEVYSIAMLVDEARSERAWHGSIKIFATDVHTEALARASEAVYGLDDIEGLSEARRRRYFVRDGDRFRVVDHLREMVVFARHDLISNAPFTQLDLICCRNVLIYLKPDVQEKVVALFHFGLRTDGLLFLGPSETPGKLLDEFRHVEGSHQLFRKRRDVTLVAQTGRVALRPRAPRVAPAERPARTRRTLQTAYDALLDLYVPPGFLLDDHGQLVHCFAGAERFLKLGSGPLQVRLTQLLSGRLLRTTVTALLHRLEDDAGEAQSVTIPRTDEPGDGAYRVSARRLPIRAAGPAYTLVSVEKIDGTAPAEGSAAAPAAVDAQYVEALERDLELAQSNLQSTVEELEASNEELQASNEELVASNEELQSTNEELHSVNEELSTVNVEYQRKIEQITEVSADLESLLQSINAGVLFLDHELAIRRINARMTELIGIGEDMLGTRFSGPDWLAAEHDLDARMRAVLAGEGPLELEIRSAEGRLMLLNLRPYESGASSGVVVTLVDVTKARHAEIEAARLSAIVRNARQAIIGKDLDGTIRSWNQGAVDLFGYSEDEIIGQPMSMLIPDSHAEQEQEILARVSRGQEVTPIETLRITKDGRRLHLQLSVSPVRAEDGTIVGASTIAWDITARKLAEQEARSAVEQRDKFLAQLSHELRNPLMALSNANTLLEAGNDEHLTKRATGIIARQIKQMSRLLEDMLDASRMRHDKIELSREIVDLRDVVASALDTVRARAEAKEIELEVSVPDDPVRAKADGSRLQQVVVNLAQNAITHSSNGGRIRMSVGADGQEARIRVADEGRGIRAEELPLIFRPFFQGEGADAKGMGLGLALARAIAIAHGGDVVASSEGEGRGATFEVRLPARTDLSATATDLPVLDVDAQRAGRSVLVCDDETESREGLALLLRRNAYDVLEAADGETALAAIAEAMPRVAIVDIGLPGIDGYEVARRVRAEHGSQQVRLIALTGFGRQADREAAMEAGFDLHLVKPIDYATIEKVIEYLASR